MKIANLAMRVLCFFWNTLSDVFSKNDAYAAEKDKYRFYEVHP